MFALDADLDELHGVAFDKGCYVGQELTARMKHRGTARKRLLPIETLDGSPLPPADSNIAAEGRDHRHHLFCLMGRAASRWCGWTDWTRRAMLRSKLAAHAVRIIKPSWLFSPLPS